MSNYFEQKLSTGPILAGLFFPVLRVKFLESIWPPRASQITASKVYTPGNEIREVTCQQVKVMCELGCNAAQVLMLA